jgi:phosphoribosyl-AMP cyclohydrolase
MESWQKKLKFNDQGLLPAIVVDHETGDVLMLAYMSRESLAKTLEEGKTCFWSRSRKKLWTKGETSGHWQLVQEIRADCDWDTLLIRVKQVGGSACHTGERSCFHNLIIQEGE